MRTLKKSLALVLALVMLLGLGVVGASADNALDNYTDADEIGDAYLEAVGVLTGLGIVDGMTETTIVPQATYTRAQAAKIITTMVLGVNGAKSCVASYAPFEDVAAEHWAAGYIAFCKEQGIIDGVTDTTFDPEGTLTGYQWAKMLLAAVGFNANNELEGSSWSLNTARIGREVGLFDGDPAGADHTPLRREQAMLYAFNTLSGIRQVTYTANGDNYVYNIWGYEWADGTGYTLGQAVFGLEGYTGIIVANEGTGADYTVLSKNYTNTATSRIASVVADTAADMMYHAARIWTVVDDHDTIGTSDDERVSVYVYDLAKVTESTCSAIDKAQSDNASKVVFSKVLGNGAEEYEYVLIDNTAYENKSYADVTFMYSKGQLGVTDAVKDTTVIAGTTVDNDDIWTDISGIAKFSEVVYMNVGGIYYVYPTSTTTGTVDKYSNVTKTITLTDGTELSASAFFNYSTLNDMGIILDTTFTFMLDSHGHFYDITREGVADLYYYTQEFQVTSDFGAYHGEHTYTAQFINVTTGEDVDLPVTSDFILDGTTLRSQGFYDLGVADANGIYTPGKVVNQYDFDEYEALAETDNVYAGKYVVELNGLRLTANSTVLNDVGGKKVYLDADAKYVIATGDGSDVSATVYNSLAEFMAAYTGNSVTLDPVALTVYTSSTDTLGCSVVFGYVGDVVSSGDFLFLADTLDNEAYTVDRVNGTVLYTYEDAFYLNGKPIAVSIPAAYASDLTRGFYSFVITNGVWELKAHSAADKTAYTGIAYVDSTSGRTWINDVQVSDSAVVVDCRDKYKDTDSAINSVDKLIAEYDNANVAMAYTVNGANGTIDVIYVLDAGWYSDIDVKLGSGMSGWTIVSTSQTEDLPVGGEQTVTIVLRKTGTKLSGNYLVDYSVKHSIDTHTGDYNNVTFSADENGDLVVNAKIYPKYGNDSTITIDDVKVALTVYLGEGEGEDNWSVEGTNTASTYYVKVGETQTVAVKYNGTFNPNDFNYVKYNYDGEALTRYLPIVNDVDGQNVTFNFGPVTSATTIYFNGISGTNA